MTFGGRARSYLLHLPPAYDKGATCALVMVLHGTGQDARTVEEMTRFSELSDRKGFIVVYPNGTGLFDDKMLTWNSGNCCGYAMDNDIDDAGFIAVLIDSLQKEFPVDPARIYVAGISNGGMLAYRIGCIYSDKIAGIASVAAAMNDRHCLPRFPVSVIAFHGTADRRVPYNGGAPLILYDSRLRQDRSVSSAMDFWVKRDACDPKAWRTENKRIAIDTWGGGLDGTEVILYTLKGGGHAWPGGRPVRYRMDEPTTDVDATQLIWDFFETHPKK